MSWKDQCSGRSSASFSTAFVPEILLRYPTAVTMNIAVSVSRLFHLLASYDHASGPMRISFLKLRQNG
jgi:hypothetical protein